MFEFVKRYLNLPVKSPTKRTQRRTNNTIYVSNEIATREKVDFTPLLGYLPDPDEILQDGGRTFPVYRQIMLDDQIRACTNSRKAGTKSLLWDIDRGDSQKSKESKIIKEFYENKLDIDEFNDAILNAPLLGYQPIEIIWGQVGNYILPIELKPKNQEWFAFDSYTNKLKLLTMNNMFEGEPVPERKFLCPTYNDIHNHYYNPYGDRILSSCFWPATFKKSGYKWWVTFCEKYGMPYLVGKLPPGQEDRRDEMMEELRAMAMDAIGVISDDCEIEAQQTGTKNSSDIYDGLIDACDDAIAKVILGQTLTTDASNTGNGSYALGKVHNEVRQDIILSDKKIVENCHNQLIQWICEINFGNIKDVPKFEMFEEEDVDMELAERDKVLTDTGVKFTKKYFIKTYGLEEEDFEVTEHIKDTEGNSLTSVTKEEQQNKKEQDKLPVMDKETEKEVKENPFSEFFEIAKDNYTDQLIAQFSDKQLQEQIKGAIQPLFGAITNAKDYKDVTKELDKLKPTMNTSEIEETLTKVIFIANLLGSKDVRDETR